MRDDNDLLRAAKEDDEPEYFEDTIWFWLLVAASLVLAILTPWMMLP